MIDVALDEREARSPHLAADLDVAERAAAVLTAHYPGHPWMVWADHAQGVVLVRNPGLPDMPGLPGTAGQFAMVIHLADIANERDFRARVMRAGGEMLERWGVARRRYEAGCYDAAVFDLADVPGVKAMAAARRRAAFLDQLQRGGD